MSELRVEQWKRKLLDLSLRNTLLNVRDSAKFMPISEGEIFAAPLPDGGENSSSSQSMEREMVDVLPPPEAGEPIKFKSGLAEKELRSRLKSLYLASRSSFNESGVNSLFFAVGFVNWCEKEGGDVHRAPLILIPAQLVRQTAAPGYKLMRTDEDAVVNFCLLEMMRSQYGIPIRDVEGGGFGDGDPDFNETFRCFADAIRDRKGWSISTGTALGMFSFSKIVIWKDLTDHFGEFSKHPFIAHLAGGSGLYDDHVSVFPQEEVEKHIRPDHLFCPLGADSSQLAAVLYSELGKTFVLHGPPGTGKSQTITNIIAHNLALGKRVLFVSEKKAALDVVYKRLASCGLAPFCLELHSNKADKVNAMRQFAEAMSVAKKAPTRNRASDCKAVEDAISELGAYARDLHKDSANGLSVYDCIGMRLTRHGQADAAFISFNAASKTPEELTAISKTVKSVADEWKGVDRECYEALRIVRTANWSPDFEEKVSQDADAIIEALSEEKMAKRVFRTLLACVKAAMRGTIVYPVFKGFGADQCARVQAVKDRLGGLRLVMSYRMRRREAVKARCEKFVGAMEAGRFTCEDAAMVFEDSCAEKTLNSMISKSRALSGFSGVKQEERISHFRELDAKYTDSTRKAIVAILANSLYSIEHPAPVKSKDGKTAVPKVPAQVSGEMAILKRECEKKKRFMPPRRLLSEAKHVAMRLKPCFLMSPLSVAQYLPTDYGQFDLVVFDEASQMTTWDAVGVIARGRQLIVVGDPKQLPPTNFFMKGDAKEDEEEENAQTEELESILDECLANGLYSAYLNWHYRSRHESLIAFSNRHYYGDRLNTFPAADVGGSRLGVSFRCVEGALYDHVTHTNKMEAQALVDYLFDRLEDKTERRRSWGIVTFSVAQQQLIEDMIEDRSKSHDWAAEFFDDSKEDAFFVKNLENVQGDERDVVMFSVAYAPDKQGRFAMSFGPVNRPGGERRLNVAITRAREQVVLFASVHSADIHAERTNSVGVKHLKALMEYAECGHLEGDVSIAETKGTAGLKKIICDRLAEWGFDFEVDVGRSSYPVDIAVKDKSNPDHFVLGIECDGPCYAAQKTVRDRDVLRGDVLTSLGWKLFRAWSVDWAFDRKGTEARLQEQLLAISSGTKTVK